MLEKLIETLRRMEDRENLFRPEYLTLDSDEVEAARVCCDCEKCYTPEDYCERVLSRMEYKEGLLSAGNRLLDAVMKDGCSVISGYLDLNSEAISPEAGEVELDWGGEYGKKFCQRCRLYGKEECPEDVHSETCARRRAVQAAEQVVSAINELM